MRYNTESHKFFCINCGKEGLPLQRRSSLQRERFHRKKMYCIYCKEELNHIECKTEEDITIFKENFTNGVYLDEAENSISYVRSQRKR